MTSPTTLREKIVAPTARPAEALPPFRRLAQSAGFAAAPFVAFCLIGGKLWLAFSVAAGLALSLAVCGMLLLFAGLGMSHLVADAHSAADRGAQSLQFTLALFAKFLVLGGVGYALMTWHTISLPAVLLGFIVAQAAVVLTAIRHWTPPVCKEARTKN